MPYTKVGWTNGETPINEDNLNHMDDQIETVTNTVENMGDSFPIGAGMDYYGTTAPTNYMFADGSAISRTDYAELFAIIGETYGAGDGSTTFNLPDKREAVTIMKGTTYDTLGASVGANTKTISKANLPNYNLTATSSEVKPKLYTGVNGSDGDAIRIQTCQSRNYSNAQVQGVTPTITVNSGGSGTALNVMQKTLVCNYIIKVK